MIELKNNRLCVSFPEIHKDASCSVDFQRTLRVPDDNQDYPLPAGLGQFPLYPVDDYPVSATWVKHGGVFLPMYQSEAMWINFDSSSGYPFAVKIAAGKINAVTGCTWSNDLSPDPQDYVVLPDQEWLDGFSVAKSVVRQFVAMPLGQGVTAEEQISGEDKWGGLQLIFYPMKAKGPSVHPSSPPRPASFSGVRPNVQCGCKRVRLDHERRARVGVPRNLDGSAVPHPRSCAPSLESHAHSFHLCRIPFGEARPRLHYCSLAACDCARQETRTVRDR